MGFLKRMIRDAIDDGISKGIRDAVSAATEKIVAPKAEAYANKVADSLDSAAEGMDAAASASAGEGGRKSAFSSLEASLNRMAQSAEKYAAVLEKRTVSQEALLQEWEKRLPDFPAWCFGGSDFRFDETGTTSDGNPYVLFIAENATEEGLALYTALLKENGFVQRHNGYDDILYKDLGGEYLVFGKTEAFNAAPTMTLSMYRTRDEAELA